MKKLAAIFLMTVTCIEPALPQVETATSPESVPEFRYLTEQFADARILRYQVPGFEKLSLKQKTLIYYLSQAALCGRDITYDQNYKYNLLIRHTLEAIQEHFSGDRSTGDFRKFTVYLKRVWFCNGIHHHYSTDKFLPEFDRAYFAALLDKTPQHKLPLAKGQTLVHFRDEMTSILFNPDIAPKRVNLDPGKDLVETSASNFYDGVTQAEAESFYQAMKEEARKNGRDTLVSFGLNSRLVKTNGKATEQVYKADGLYSQAITKVIAWLEKALTVTETPEQHLAVQKLIEYYRTGNLVTWDEYNIEWVKDLNSKVDFVNGFIEVYGDPLATKGTWEALVNFKDEEATRRTEIISANAQYFEDHSPVAPEFKKKKVRGVTAKVITAAILGGDCHPTTPIGINLPNANWIRKDYGSKSVTIDNITYSYDQAAKGNGFLQEFAASPGEVERAESFGYLAGNLTTDLHECLGHGSGQLNKGVSGDALKNYHSTIEEARADLFALYYIGDPKMADLGLVTHPGVWMAEYDNFIRNGLMTQLVRIQPGKTIEESHMRDRALIAHWVYEKGLEEKVIEKFVRDGKTCFRINQYDRLRKLFGELLNLVQRITSEGDYQAARELVERYAVQVDGELHKEVLERYARLKLAPYAGFINPEYRAVVRDGEITNVEISYPDNFLDQMMQYSKRYSNLPVR